MNPAPCMHAAGGVFCLSHRVRMADRPLWMAPQLSYGPAVLTAPGATSVASSATAGWIRPNPESTRGAASKRSRRDVLAPVARRIRVEGLAGGAQSWRCLVVLGFAGLLPSSPSAAGGRTTGRPLELNGRWLRCCLSGCAAWRCKHCILATSLRRRRSLAWAHQTHCEMAAWAERCKGLLCKRSAQTAPCNQLTHTFLGGQAGACTLTPYAHQVVHGRA